MQTIILNNLTFIQTPNEFNALMKSVYKSLELLNDEYPDFEFWYINKVISETQLGKRSIIVKKYNKEIAAISILKNDLSEKKISTFRVIEKYQYLGIGSILMEESLHCLKTIHPKITVSELRIEQFNKLLRKFDFQLNSLNKNYYRNDVTEFSFNGPIEKESPIIPCSLQQISNRSIVSISDIKCKERHFCKRDF